MARPRRSVAERSLSGLNSKFEGLPWRARERLEMVDNGLPHLPRRIDGSRGKLINHAAGVACPLSPIVRASSYSCEMSLFV